MFNWFKKYKTELILSIAILAYIVIFSYLSIRKVYTLQSNYFDLGIMHQVVYNTAEGRFLEMTNQDFGKNISRLAIHFDPILAFIAPFYKIWDGPETLLVIQTIILGLGALAVFLIAKKLLKNKLMSLIFAISYLLYFPVERANVFDFHAVTLATTFLLFMIYFSLIQKYWFSLIFILLSFLTKEHVGLITFLFGLYLYPLSFKLQQMTSSIDPSNPLFRSMRAANRSKMGIFVLKKERRYSLLIMLISILTFVVTVMVVIPYFRQESHFALKYFKDSGISTILKSENIAYLFKLFFANIIFIIFSPIELLISLPEILINTLSSNANMKLIYFHYNSLIVPFIFFSVISGYKKIQDNKILNKYKKFFLCIFILCNLISIYYFNPLPFSFLKEPYWWGEINNGKLSVLKKLHESLDNRQKVATTPKIAPFFTGRQYYYNFLYDSGYVGMNKTEGDIIKKIDYYNLADYIVIDRAEIFDSVDNLPRKFYQNLQENRNYRKILSDKTGIEVYKKFMKL